MLSGFFRELREEKKEEKTTIDGRKARQYNVKRVNQEMYPSG